MLYAVGAKDTDPYVKKTNAGGKTTLVQDPSSYYVNKGYTNLQNVNANAVSKTQPKASTPTAAATPSAAQSESYSGGGESYGGEGGGASFDFATYLAELLAERQRRADEAYERNMKRIADAYNSAAANLKSNYDSTETRLGVSRDQSLSDVNKDAEDSLRQAYINNMLTKKNMGQRLSAMGYNGGAAESTMASLENNYGNSRTSIGDTLNNNINKLNMNYGDNLANALQSYNTAMSDLDQQRMQLEMQAEAQRQNALDSLYSSFGGFMGGSDSAYLSALQSALSSMGNYSYTPTVATNDFVPGQAQQAASAAQSANMSKYLAQARLQRSNGAKEQEIKNTLFDAVDKGDIDIYSLYNILKQLQAGT